MRTFGPKIIRQGPLHGLGHFEGLGLDGEILEHISHDGWDKVFNIKEPIYRELTLEVLSTIKMVRHYNFV